MFQPTNQSYVERLVQVSLDSNMNESEEERAARYGQPYRESEFHGCAPHLLQTLAHWLAMAAGRSPHPRRNVGVQRGPAISE